MKNSPDIYTVFAVALPLALGLGLIYLFVMGGMDATSVVLALVAMVMLVPLAGVLVDAASVQARRSSEARLRRTMRRRRRSADLPNPGDSAG